MTFHLPVGFLCPINLLVSDDAAASPSPAPVEQQSPPAGADEFEDEKRKLKLADDAMTQNARKNLIIKLREDICYDFRWRRSEHGNPILNEKYIKLIGKMFGPIKKNEPKYLIIVQKAMLDQAIINLLYMQNFPYRTAADEIVISLQDNELPVEVYDIMMRLQNRASLVNDDFNVYWEEVNLDMIDITLSQYENRSGILDSIMNVEGQSSHGTGDEQVDSVIKQSS